MERKRKRLPQLTKPKLGDTHVIMVEIEGAVEHSLIKEYRSRFLSPSFKDERCTDLQCIKRIELPYHHYYIYAYLGLSPSKRRYGDGEVAVFKCVYTVSDTWSVWEEVTDEETGKQEEDAPYTQDSLSA